MFDNPIFFLILLSLLAAASDWIGKRRKSRQADGNEEENIDEETPSRRRNFKEKQQQWEERLRRLLEGEVEPIPSESKPPEPPPRPASPPTLREQTPPPVREVRPSFQSATHRASVDSPKISRSFGKDQKVQREWRRFTVPLSQRFRNRQAVRQAVIASVVFGPSKGTEENSDLLRF